MPTGLTQDAGWEIGVSRTLPLPTDAVWAFVTSLGGLALWLGAEGPLPTGKGEPYEAADGVRGEIRGYRPGEHIRLTHGDTTVQLTVSAGGPGKTVLRFHQERLASAQQREQRRAHWRAVMDRVAAALLPEGGA